LSGGQLCYSILTQQVPAMLTSFREHLAQASRDIQAALATGQIKGYTWVAIGIVTIVVVYWFWSWTKNR
jgi:hypothetical protein